MAKQLSNTPIQDNAPGIIKTVPLTEILADPEKNSRRFPPDPKKLITLSKDLIVRGQLFPLLVLERNGDAANGGCPYELVDGFRRYAAMGIAGENGSPMSAMVRIMPDMDAVEAYKTSIAANNPNLREEPSLMDQAYQIVALKERGVLAKAIAEEMGMSGTWVSITQKFVTLRPEIQKRIHTKDILWTVARHLPDLSEEEQDKMLERVARAKEIGEAPTDIAEGGKKRKKDKRGRKAKGSGEEGAGKKGPSIKVALNACEEYSVEPVADPETGKVPKETKAEETERLIFEIFGKFLAGKIGQQAMRNQIRKLL